MEGPAMDESRVRKRQRVGLFPASDDLDFSVACPFSDVKLVSASGAVLYGSRYNLVVRSSFCKQMLLGGMREAQSVAMSDVVTIPFPGLRTEVLLVLLEFCTSGCFSEKRVQQTPVDVIHAARYFRLTDDMEELVGSVMEDTAGGSKVDGTLAETLSLALECLPTDLETLFFERLVKKIFSRPIFHLPYPKLSSQALEYLLSKTLECSEPWASGFPFCSSEFSIFRYVLQWSAHQISEDAQKRMQHLYDEIPDGESFNIQKCAPGTAEVLESAAVIARPFLAFVDFRLIPPEQIAQDIEPLNIVPDKMLLAALCHHAKDPNSSTTIFYRGPYVLQWSLDACGSGFLIDDSAEGREVYCESETAGFARAHSCFQGSGEHSWIVTVSDYLGTGGIGIGFCSDPGLDYSKWLGYSSDGCILDLGGRLWHNGSPMKGSDGSGRLWDVGRPSALEGRIKLRSLTPVQVTVNLDTGTYRFTLLQAGQKGASLEFRAPDQANLPRLIYPAVTFYKSRARVSLCPMPV